VFRVYLAASLWGVKSRLGRSPSRAPREYGDALYRVCVFAAVLGAAVVRTNPSPQVLWLVIWLARLARLGTGAERGSSHADATVCPRGAVGLGKLATGPCGTGQGSGRGVIAVGCAEELLFRGWLLQELDQDYPLPVAMISSSGIFALLHFLKPLDEILNTWTQGLGLVILGMLLVWARRQSGGRLGLAIGLHGGLVWGYYIIRVGQLVRYPGTVPAWVTGINDNPLAGLAGLFLITLLATILGLRWRQQSLRLKLKEGL
jgi:Type II CAAX prenyl endopeptidase Rce1-like